MPSWAPRLREGRRRARTGTPLVHLVDKGWQVENSKAVTVGGLIVAIVGTIATIVGVWLQFGQHQPQPPDPTSTAITIAPTTEPTTEQITEPSETRSEPTTEPPEIGSIPMPEIQVPESDEPLFTTHTLQELFDFPQNGDCRDSMSNYVINDVAVLYCTSSDSPVYFYLHKYAGISAAGYLGHYPSSLQYRSYLEGPHGERCADRYLNTFTGDDGVIYNSKIVHFLSTPFLVEINSPAHLYSRASIEQVSVHVNSELACPPE